MRTNRVVGHHLVSVNNDEHYVESVTDQVVVYPDIGTLNTYADRKGAENMLMVNIWLGVTTTAKTAINNCLGTPEDEYNGPVTPTERRIFERMIDRGNVQRMFKTAAFGGKSWVLYSLYFDLNREGANKLKNALDFLEENRAGHITVAGAWFRDGRQAGTTWVRDENGERTFDILVPGEPYTYEDYVLDEFGEKVIESTNPETGEITYQMEEKQGMTPDTIRYITEGTPTYPIPVNQLLKFMPDIEEGVPATELTDVNLQVGQKPRRFS